MTTVEAYNQASNTWVTKASLLTPRYYMGTAIVGGTLYVMGGADSSTILASMEAYDPATDSWVTRAALPTPRSGLVAAAINGLLYTVGGSNGSALPTVEAYNPVLNTWTTKASIPELVSQPAVAILAGTLYICGGVDAAGNPTSSVYSYDPPSDSWTQRNTLLMARGGDCAVTVGGVIYVMAGQDPGSLVLSSVETYSATNGVWSSATSLTSARFMPGAASLGGTIYVVGGLSASGYEGSMEAGVVAGYVPPPLTAQLQVALVARPSQGFPGEPLTVHLTVSNSGVASATLFAPALIRTQVPTAIYSQDGPFPSAVRVLGPGQVVDYIWTLSLTGLATDYLTASITGTDWGTGGPLAASALGTLTGACSSGTLAWSSVTGMSAARTYVDGVAVDGKIYCIGGNNAGGSPTNTNEAYDPLTDTWTPRANMPTTRRNMALARLGGTIYAIGGWNGTQLTTVEAYDTATDTWTTLAPMPTARECAAAALWGKIFAIGGSNGASALSVVERYDPASNSWTTRSSLPVARWGLRAVGVEASGLGGGYPGKIYSLGGGTPGGTVTPFIVEEFDDSANAWTPKMPRPGGQEQWFTAQPVDGVIHTLGGTANNASASLASYDLLTDSWSNGTSLPVGRYAPASAVLGGKLYVVGGTNSSGTVLATADVATFTCTPAGAPAVLVGSVAAIPSSVTVGQSFMLVLTVSNTGGNAATGVTALGIDGHGTGGAAYLAGPAPATGQTINPGGLVTFTYTLQGAAAGTVLFSMTAVGTDAVTTAPVMTAGAISGPVVVTPAPPAPLVWSFVAPMPTARAGLAVTVLGGTLYAIGGSNGGNLATVEAYYAGSNIWAARASISGGRNMVSSATVGGTVYVLGGSNGAAVATVEAYDPATNTWAAKASLSSARESVGSAAVNGLLYAIGGANGPPVATVEAYDPATNTWTPKANMLAPRNLQGIVVVGGTIYACGGNDEASAASSSVYAYDTATDSWTVKAPLPSPHGWTSAAVVNGVIYVTAGNSGGLLSTVEAYDITSNSWSTNSNLNTARWILGTARIGGTVYVVGGSPSSGYLASVEAAPVPGYIAPAVPAQLVASLSVNPPTSATGQSVTVTLTFSNTGGTSATALVPSLSAILGGGLVTLQSGPTPASVTLLPPGTTTAFNWVYLTSSVSGGTAVFSATVTGQDFLTMAPVSAMAGAGLTVTYTPVPGGVIWTTRPSMPTSRWTQAGAVLGGTVYVIGGAPTTGGYASVVEAFDTAANAWTTKASLLMTSSSLAAVTLSGSIYAMGGNNCGGCDLAMLEVYDPVTNTWTAKANMLSPHGFTAAASVGGTIYVVGGRNNGPPIGNVEAYDPVTNSWTALASMPTAKYQHAAVTLGGTIYVVGGDAGAGSVATMDAYYPATNTWAARAPMPTARAGVSTVAVGATIYAIGGSGGASMYTTVEAYDPGTDTWTTVTPMQIKRWEMAAAAIGGTIYTFGGYDGASVPVGQTVESGVVAGFVPPPPPTAQLAASLVLPTSITVGQWFTLGLSVTNTGGNTANGVVPTLGITSGSVYATLQSGPTPPGPLNILPGGATMFVWTYSTAGQGTMVFSVTVQGLDAITSATVTGTAVGSLTSTTTGCPPVAVTVAATQTPASPVIGSPVTYRIVVTNTGAGTITDLTITDTVSPVVAVPVGDQPVGFAAPTVTGGASVTRFVWSRSGFTMNPGTAFTFTISGTVGTVCATVGVGNTVFLTAGSVCTATSLQSNATGFSLTLPTISFAVTKQQVAPAGIGSPVVYRVIIQNTSSTTVTNLVVTDTVSPVIMSASAMEPAGFPTPIVASIASGTNFFWSAGGIQFFPNAVWTFTISGTAGAVCVGTTVSNTAFMSGGDSCVQSSAYSNAVAFALSVPTLSFTVVKTQTPASPGPGSPVAYTIVVTNTGGGTITGVTVTDTISPVITAATGDQPAGFGAPVVTGGASGTKFAWSNAAVSFGPGQTYTFTITGTVGTVLSQTQVSNTGYVTGANACAMLSNFTSAVGFTATPAGTPAVLAASLVLPATPTVGQWFTVGVSVTNTGGTAANAVLPDLGLSSGGGLVVLESGPTPPGPLTIGPGGATLFFWTYSTAGQGTMYFTATIQGLDAVSSATVMGTAVGSLTATVTGCPAVSFTVVATQSTTGGIGAAVSYRVVVTNTGAGTLTDVMVVDTMSPLVVGASQSFPAGFSPAAVTSVAGGTQYVWSGTGLTFLPGMTLTLTLTGSLGLVCGATSVSSTAYVVVASACAQANAIATTGVVTVLPAVTGLQVVKLQTPASPPTGSPVTYRIVVANTGTATITSLTVSDTVSPVVTGVTTDQPAGIGAPVMTGGASATRIHWSGSGLTFVPGMIWSFTIAGTVGAVGVPTAVSNTAFIVGISDCSATTMQTIPIAFTVTSAGSSAVLVSSLLVPPSAFVGQWFTVGLSVTNTGGNATIGVAPDLGLSSGGGLVVLESGPTPPGPLTIGPGGATLFFWTYSTAGAGALFFTATVQGLDALTSATVMAAATAPMTASATGCAALSFTVVTTQSPAAPGIGAAVTYGIVVTNTGAGIITDLSLTDTLSPVLLVTGQDVPVGFTAAMVTAVAGGTRYAWSGTGLSVTPGTALTFTVTGIMGTVCVPTQVAATAFVTASSGCAQASGQSGGTGAMIQPATTGLTVSETLTPAAPVPGGGITYRIVVANTGAATMTGLLVNEIISSVLVGVTAYEPFGFSAATVGPAGGGTQYLWNAPAFTVLPGQSFTFTLTGTVGVVGSPVVISNTVYVVGTTDCASPTQTSSPVGFTASPTGGAPLGAFAALLATPSPAVVGQVFPVSLTVTNTGSGAVSTVLPTLTVTSGAGNVAQVSGPVPASVGSLPVAGSQTFVWTFSGLGTGLVVFAGSVTGTDATTFNPVFASNVRTLNIFPPAALAASVAAAPFPVPVRRRVVVALTVTNTGGVTATGVTPALAVAGSTLFLELPMGPIPAGPVSIPPGGVQTFLWSYSVSGAGLFGFNANAAGTDAVSGYPVAAGSSASATAYAMAILTPVLSLFPPQPHVGEVVTVHLDVFNDGAATATGITASLAAPGAGGFLFPLVSLAPQFVAQIVPYGTTAFEWTFSVTGAGGVNFAASVGGVDQGVLGLALGALGNYGLTIAAPQTVQDLVLGQVDSPVAPFPNPVPAGSDTVGVAMKLTFDATVITVEVFNANLDLLYKGVYHDVKIADGGVSLSGVRQWPPGVYLLRVTAECGNGKAPKVFPMTKVVVSP